jgi:hypothetical protein
LSIERNFVFVKSSEARTALLLSKKISFLYEVQKRSFERNKIYNCWSKKISFSYKVQKRAQLCCCKKKSRLHTKFRSAALIKIKFTIVERNLVFVWSSKTRFEKNKIYNYRKKSRLHTKFRSAASKKIKFFIFEWRFSLCTKFRNAFWKKYNL